MPVSRGPRHPYRKPPQRPAEPMPVHARLSGADGRLLAGGARRGEEWVLVLQGRVAAATDSPSMLLAMLQHTAAMFEAAGEAVRLEWSDTLRDLATAEAEDEGRSLDEHLAALEAERLERAQQRNGTGPALQ